MDPAWSPDGESIAIRRNISGNNEIVLIDAADGSNPVNLTNHSSSDFEPDFSPDGSKIVFQRYSGSGSGIGLGNEVFIMAADGTDQTNLTDNSGSINDGRPSFSPDGSRIAFDSNRNDSLFEIYTMDPDGSDVVRLTDEAGNKQNPIFSPAGDLIAFSGSSGITGIGLGPVAGGDVSMITAEVDSVPHWGTDSTAPATSITDGPADASTATVRNAGFTFSADEAEASFECRIDPDDGGEWVPCTSPKNYADLVDGEHSFAVRATDLGGNVEATPASRIWQIDATVPVVEIESGPTGTVTVDSATIGFTVDDASATVECRLDSSDEGDWAACSSPLELTGLGQGEHSLEVRATDPAGNVSTLDSLTWTVDTVAPVTTIDSAPPAQHNSIQAAFEFSADEGDVTFECRLDPDESTAWESCVSPAGYTNLSDGEHNFEVRATDAAGNTGAPATHTWEIATIKPVATIDAGPTGTVASEDATFEFSSGDPAATFECRLDSEEPGDWAACASPQNYTGLAQGEHTFEVRATETDQGTGPVASQSWSVDTVAPVITFDQAPPAFTSSPDAVFEYSVDDPDATIECRLHLLPDPDWHNCLNRFETSGLDPDTYTFEVRATDQVGNASVATHTWTIDQTAPTATIDAAPPALNNSVRATFEFSADESPVSFDCRLDSSDETGWEECVSPLNLDDLTDGEHSLEIRPTDAAGNVGAVVSHTWEVATVKPVASITAGPSGPVANTTAVFEFESDLGSAIFECRIDAEDDGEWAICTSPATFENLPDGEHLFEVRATEIDQGTGPVASATWVVDTITPTVELTGTPAPISGTADPSFAFTASEEGTTSECRLDPADENDPWVACASPVDFSGLTEGEHHFEVRVNDAVGHVSEPATFNWIVETTPPDVTVTSDLPDDPTTFIDASFEFESSNLNAYFECRFDGGDWAVCESPYAVDQLIDGAHSFEVRAVGHGAGPGPVQTVDWTVDTTVPTVLITARPHAVTTRTNGDFEFETNKSGFTFQCSLDGGAPAACSSPAALTGLAAGDHTFHVDALDQDSQVVDSATYEWTILAAAPEVTITESPASVSGSSTAAFQFNSDQAAASFECRLDGGAWQSCTSPAAFTGLGDGSHTVGIRTALDDGPALPIYGPVAEHTWQVDTTAPEVRISGGPNGIVTSSSATFNVTSDDGAATTECRLDNGAWQACAGEVTFSDLADGSHELRVRSVDAAGNTGADRREWSIDSDAPIATLTETPDASTTERSARFDFSANEAGVVFECSLDGGDWASCSPVFSADGLDLGAHEFKVRATDQYGNTGEPVSFVWEIVRPPFKGLVPTIKLQGKLKLNRDGTATLARINCPEGNCRITAPKRVTFRVKGRKGTPGIKVIRTEFTGRANATLVSSPRVRKLVRRAGSVRVKVRLKVVSENGKSRTVTKRVKLTAGR